MRTEVIRREAQQTGVWSGGTTTQLAIWPPDSDYKQRRFDWRISTARVDEEESTFTSLPGVHRLIMILRGRVRLIHEGHHEARLGPFEQDSFEGEWNTVSRGQCQDFNLMTTGGCFGRLEALQFTPEGLTVSLFSHLPAEDADATDETVEAFYSLSSGLHMTVRHTEGVFETALNEGDFVLLRGAASDAARATFTPAAGSEDCPLIRATVQRRA